RKKSIKQAPRKKTLARAAPIANKRLDADRTPIVAIPFDHKGAWVVRCPPGLGRTAVSEMVYRRVLSRDEKPVMLRQRNHDLVFVQAPLSGAPWGQLRIAEEVYACIVFGRYKVSAGQLDTLAAALRLQGRTFRVIATADGSHFPRHEMGHWLAQELKARMVPINTDGRSAVHLFCVEEAYYVCLLQTTGAEALHRSERKVERPGSLPPAIAAGIAFLGRPEASDIILDPVCGSGTLLAEAFAFAPEATFIGIDSDRGAVAAARQNLSHIPDLRVSFGDAVSTELAAASVTLFLANLPFGKQFGDKPSNPQLYRQFVTEMQRLGSPGKWRAALFTSDVESLERVLKEAELGEEGRRIRIAVRGEWATLFLVSAARDER
ncbi:MAG: hypothetical protein M3Y56_04745, partial [Armatimonadota bacterium]|nr:hypothetical protein [Armatimonadota bacterium]